MSGSKSAARIATLVLFTCVIVLASTVAVGQSTNANLTGTVFDSSGAVIVEAQLTLTNLATNAAANVQSDDKGQFSFREVIPGNYSLTTAKSGFSTTVQQPIVMTLNASVRQDVTLKAGQATQRIEVIADASLVNFENATVQGGIEPETLKDLPLAIANGNQRSSAQLTVLMPGVTTSSSGDAFNARINGGTQNGDEAILDGATLAEGFLNQSGLVAIHGDFPLSPDMISETKVIASTYEPQYGFTTGGQIVVTSKSGGASFHGSGYGYLRNSALNAAQWGAGQTTFDQEYDAGANIGGPIKLPGFNTRRNKGFFFFNFERFKLNGGATQPVITIPTLKERGGDFTDLIDDKGLIPIFDPRTGNQFSCGGVLNTICTADIDPIASAWLAQLPQPTNDQLVFNYRVPYGVPNSLGANTQVYLFRIDDNLGNSDRFFFTFYRQYGTAPLVSLLPRAIATENSQPSHSGIYRFNWQHLFNANVVNHFTVGYLDRKEDQYSLDTTSNAKLPTVAGVANTTDYLPQFNFSMQLGEASGPVGHNVHTRPTWAINDIVGWVVHSHTLMAGVESRIAQGKIYSAVNQGGTFSFGGVTTNANLIDGGGNPLRSGSLNADFLLGAVNDANVTYYNVPVVYPRQAGWAFHFGDTWRATSKLTVNYGLRWDVQAPIREKQNRFSFLDPTVANVGTGSFLGGMAFATSSRPYPERVYHGAWAPRFGVAYAPNPSTVVRAGYGIFFGQAFYQGWNGGMNLDGYNVNSTISSPGLNSTGNVIPSMCLTTGNVFCVAAGVPANGYPTPTSLAPSLSPDIDNGGAPLYRQLDGNRRPRSQQWNLTIERQLPLKFVASAGYVGAHGTHLLSALQPINVLNPNDPRVQANLSILGDAWSGQVPEPYPGWHDSISCASVGQALLPFPQYCSNLQGLNENVGNSIYHSFQARVERRFDRGIYMLLSYTNSKIIEDASSNTQSAALTWNGSGGGVSPYERRRARTLASDDVPQVLSAAFVYDFPIGRGKRFLNSGGVVNALVGGWQISPIYRFSRGIPFAFRSGTCRALSGSCMPGVLPGAHPFLQDPNHFDPGKGALLDVNAFEAGDAFLTVGYSGTGTRISNLRGSNFKNMDFSLSKETHITERVTFKFSANFFNAFNAHYFVNSEWQNFGGDAAFATDVADRNGFGTWNGNTSSPRTIQVSGRIEF